MPHPSMLLDYVGYVPVLFAVVHPGRQTNGEPGADKNVGVKLTASDRTLVVVTGENTGSNKKLLDTEIRTVNKVEIVTDVPTGGVFRSAGGVRFLLFGAFHDGHVDLKVRLAVAVLFDLGLVLNVHDVFAGVESK